MQRLSPPKKSKTETAISVQIESNPPWPRLNREVLIATTGRSPWQQGWGRDSVLKLRTDDLITDSQASTKTSSLGFSVTGTHQLTSWKTYTHIHTHTWPLACNTTPPLWISNTNIQLGEMRPWFPFDAFATLIRLPVMPWGLIYLYSFHPSPDRSWMQTWFKILKQIQLWSVRSRI